MTPYLTAEQTARHEPLVYRVSRFIIAEQGRTISVRELCERFLADDGGHTKSNDTRMRNIVEEYVADLMFDKLIVSTHDGYLHPNRNQEDVVIESFDKMDATARAIGIRRRRQLKRLKLDGQFKLALGKHDKPVYEAITDADAETYTPKRKRAPSASQEAEEAEVVIIYGDSGQGAMRI